MHRKPTSDDQGTTQSTRKKVNPLEKQPTMTDPEDKAMWINNRGVRQKTLHTYEPSF